MPRPTRSSQRPRPQFPIPTSRALRGTPPFGAGGWSAVPRSPSGGEVTVTTFPFPPGPQRCGERQQRRPVLPPPARPRRGPALPRQRLFSPAPRRRSASRAPQGGQEAGAPAARPPARKMVTSAGQLALFALGTYAVLRAPCPARALPAATPRFPLTPSRLFSRGREGVGVLCPPGE